MTVKVAAERWNASEWQVRSWCRKGYIEGAAKKGNRWVIPEGAECPYLTRKKKFSRPYEKTDYVLKAIGSERYLDFRLLALSPEEFAERTQMLVREGLVEQTGNGHRLTLAGEERLRQRDDSHRKEVRDTISTVVSLVGPVTAVMSMLG